jgi:pyruvate kinase
MSISTSEQNRNIICNYFNLDLSVPQNLLSTLQILRQSIDREGQQIFQQWQPVIVRKTFWDSCLNLSYYLALRQHDLRPLQLALKPWGLSSLGRIEAQVMANLDAVISTLGKVCGVDPALLPSHLPVEKFFEGDRLLQSHTEDVFGKAPTHRQVRIMVTLPTIAANDYQFVKDLLQRGTDCVRINCAHDTINEWEAAIAHVRQAERETGRSCKVLMDLGGPKPRLGEVRFAKGKQKLFVGDSLLLKRDSPKIDHFTDCQASCTIPEILDRLQVGASVWIDDGRIGAIVESITPEGVRLQITHARPKGEKIRPDKGLNFPDTLLRLSSLTDKDRKDLDFVATHADIIGYSFVQEVADIVLLQQELKTRLGERAFLPAIVAKIETPEAIRNLPELIVYAAGKQPFTVMIARGDLAVEIGYQRLAEMQEEILWLCEAAHVPVIWATQVLENLVKKGIPSRSEMTDAAMSERAECVMLNKGEYLAQAVTILDDVLTRMQAHQSKKTPQLRALNSWNLFENKVNI